MKNKTFITEELVFAHETDDIYLSDKIKDCFPNISEEEIENIENEIIYIETNPKNLLQNYSQYSELSILDLKAITKKLENNKANRVGIYYHPDHSSYYFYGINVHLSTKSEIDIYNEKIKKEKDMIEYAKKIEAERHIKILEELGYKIQKPE